MLRQHFLAGMVLLLGLSVGDWVSAQELPAVEPGVYRSGSFAARVGGATVSIDDNTANGGGRLRGDFTITVFNTGAEPLSIIIIDAQRASGRLNNGVVLGAGAWVNRFSVATCRRQPVECRASQAADYTQLGPGETATFNVTMLGSFRPEQRGTLPTIESVSLSMRAHIIRPASDNAVQISLANVSVRPPSS